MRKLTRSQIRGLRFLCVLILILTVVSIVGFAYLSHRSVSVSLRSMPYDSSTDALDNPYCGWYRTYDYVISEEEPLTERSIRAMVELDGSTRLVSLTVDLSAYASGEISAEGLEQIQTIIASYAEADKQIMLLFCYNTQAPTDGDVLYLHMEEISSLVNDYSAKIIVAKGFITNAYGTVLERSYLTETAIEEYVDYWAALTNYDLMQTLDTSSGIGSAYGLSDGAEAIAYLQENQISYLSADEDTQVYDAWLASLYEPAEADAFYGTSVYEYVSTHLGYRYRVSAVSLGFDTWNDESAEIAVSIVNEGFASCSARYDISLILRNQITEELISIPLAIDNREIGPNASATAAASLNIRDYEAGTYDVFLMMMNPSTGEQIKLANVMESTNNGYMIGTLTVSH